MKVRKFIGKVKLLQIKHSRDGFGEKYCVHKTISGILV